MIKIAIDGPSGSGKSTLAKALASKIGYVYVDTGALYRSIALYMLDNGAEADKAENVINELSHIALEMKHDEHGVQHVFLNGSDVGDRIRTSEVSAMASRVSAIPEVRRFLLDTQRDIARVSNVIMDGRDIGTVIFPDADVKIFLTAGDRSRAERRYRELIAKGENVTLEKVLSDMEMRDKNDRTRTEAPAIPASDAVFLDNSELSPEATVEAALKIIKDKIRS